MPKKPTCRVWTGQRWVFGRVDSETQRGKLIVSRRVQRKNRMGNWVFVWQPFRRTFTKDQVTIL